MTLASSNLNIDLEARMRRERAGDSEYITEGIYDQLKTNEAGGGKLLFLERGGGVVSDFTSTGVTLFQLTKLSQGQISTPLSVYRLFTRLFTFVHFRGSYYRGV